MDLNLWKKTYDLRDDKNIEIKSQPEYSFHTALGNLYLKLETPYGPDDGDDIPRFFRLNKQGQFVRELNPPALKERIKVLPEDLWQ